MHASSFETEYRMLQRDNVRPYLPLSSLTHTHTHTHTHILTITTLTYRVYLCYLCSYEQPCHSRGSVGVMYTQNWSLWEVGML